MRVLITGSSGMVGQSIVEHLSDRDDYEFRGLDVEDHPDLETTVASVDDYEAIRPAFEGVDAVVHLAVYPEPISNDWPNVLDVNVIGTRNVLEAAADAGVEQVVFASTNHVVGGYEDEFAPELYRPDFGLTIDHTSPVRPDSLYGVSKVFGEALGRYYVEKRDAPDQFYALRIGTLLPPEYDQPYGSAESAVDEGHLERGSAEYERSVRRGYTTWLSRRDCAHLVDCCLRDGSVDFDVFYAVSDNANRWVDIEHARETVGYDPRDSADEWDWPSEA